MRNSLIKFALSFAPEMKRRTTEAVKHQRAEKLEKRNRLRLRKLIAAQREYANALTFIEMYHSDACWKTGAVARREYSKLGSKTAKLDAVKEQIRIRVIGFGWKDLSHPWSKNGKEYLPDDLLEHLVEMIIPKQQN